MLKEVLKSIIQSQQNWQAEQDKEIPRDQLSDFTSLLPFGYFLTGVRRSGKSTLMKQIMRHYGSVNYFNFEDSRAAGFELDDFLKVEELFFENTSDNKWLFFDEIQNIHGWERYIRDAIDRNKTVVITGSNASLLSRELGTKLTGRHLDYEVFPFSYTEFLRFNKIPAEPDSFASFMTKGGFPGFLNVGNQEILSTLVSDILIRDIFSRYNLRNQDVYRMLVQYLLSNTGKEVSFNNLKNTFEIGSASSVMEFINYLVDAYLIFMVPRYDTSLKVQAKNPRKVYGIDQGMVSFSSVSGSPDLGRLLENTVYLHLRRSRKEIWYFKGRKECDFICRDTGAGFSAIQVSLHLGQQNESREIEGLFEAMDKLNLSKGTIITFDQEDKFLKDGKTVRLIPGWKWLSGLQQE